MQLPVILRRSPGTAAAVCAVAVSGSPLRAGSEAAQAFLNDFCMSCHNADKRKGDVRLDDLSADVVAEGTRWAVVRDMVRSGEMPPDSAKKQPASADRSALISWVNGQLGAHAQVKPNLGNLVPHELLFESGAVASNSGTAPRLWRLSPDAYLGWVREMVGREPDTLVQPFTGNPERGIKDFAALSRIDEPTTEVLIRNAEAIVEKQTAVEIVDGKVRGPNGSVREFIEIMASDAAPSPEQLEKAIQKQFQLAVARRADAEEVARLAALYGKAAENGDRKGALRTMLAAVLLRSDAVFREELGGPDGMLTPREAAAAVSAALMHRRERGLFEAAEKGRLNTRDDLAGHIRRLLDDPKLEKPKLLGFWREYFEYGGAPAVFKDEPKDLWHRPDQAVLDTDRLVLHLVSEDKDVFRRMLTTPLAFANVKLRMNKQTRQEELQRSVIPNEHNQRGKAVPETLYGLTEWTERQPFEQAPDTRLGILMQPSWLVAWSENFNNDIVRRGRFIRERLLGGTVPDLPIGVAAMIPEDKTRTLRDRVSSVTRAEACWKCHRHMDELGLPFEQFDHFGRLLTQDSVLDPEATKANVDKKGQTLGDVYKPAPLVRAGAISGTGDPQLDGPVSSPYELVHRIAASDRARQVWIRHVFRYYLGRNESLADAATLQAADKAYLESGGSFKAVLVSLLTSDSFLKRTKS